MRVTEEISVDRGLGKQVKLCGVTSYGVIAGTGFAKAPPPTNRQQAWSVVRRSARYREKPIPRRLQS